MKKANNWILISLLVGLVVIFAALRIFRSPTLESNLPANLTEIDSAKVNELIIVPAKARTNQIRLIRTGKKWELKNGDRTGRLEQRAGATALQSLMDLKPQRIATKRKEKWNEFGVGDSTGTHVKVMAGTSAEADLWIGRTGFLQSPDGNFAGGFTYIRMSDKNDVYAVNTFLEGAFNRDFNDWRDKGFVRLKRDSVDKITFRYPADSSFVLEKRNGKWMMGAVAADSAAIVGYLVGLENKNISTFAEVIPAGAASVDITFEKTSKVVAKIEGWPAQGAWTIRSAYQADTFFSLDGSGVTDLWKGRIQLGKKEKKEKTK